MQLLWLIFLLVTDSTCVLFLTHPPAVSSAISLCTLPSFVGNIVNKQKEKKSQILSLLGLLDEPLNGKPFGVDFLFFVNSTKLQSGSNAVHEDVHFTPMTWRWKTGYDIPERQTE